MYEIIYYTDDTYTPCSEETDTYCIFEISEAGNLQRIHSQKVGGVIEKYDDEWFEYSSTTGFEKSLTEEEMFSIAL